MTASFAIWPTTKTVLSYVWRERHLALRYATLPVAILIVLDIIGSAAGIDIDTSQWWNVFASVASLVTTAPLTVTWYQAVIRGEAEARARPVIAFSHLEGAVIALNIQIAAVFLGAFVAAGAGVAIPYIFISRIDETAGQILGILLAVPALFLVVMVMTRQSVAIAFAAVEDGIGLRGAWRITKGIGARLTWIHVALAIVAGAPALLARVVIGGAAHADMIGPSSETLIASAAETFFETIYLLFATTLFGLAYRALAAEAPERLAVAAGQPA